MEFLIIRARAVSRNCKHLTKLERASNHRFFCGRNVAPSGGIKRGLRIKVGNMVPACCECKSGGSIADTLFYKRLSLTKYLERCGPPSHPAAGGE